MFGTFSDDALLRDQGHLLLSKTWRFHFLMSGKGLGSKPGEDMDVCKCIVPLRHGCNLNSLQAERSSSEVGGIGREMGGL
ncbi:hypothetical protein TNCV_1849131 [Trichonephila clavipes]|nr:hypothetical protein TNCV_1849131 [Trichonephila clavipes]